MIETSITTTKGYLIQKNNYSWKNIYLMYQPNKFILQCELIYSMYCIGNMEILYEKKIFTKIIGSWKENKVIP